MNELSLFTGAGGGILGTHLLGWRPIGYVEWDDYCQRVLAARIADGHIPAAPIFTDVREFAQSGAADEYRGLADVVTAGFPCQPFSVAGKQQAADDDRNMWPATADVIRRVQPRSVLLENVPGLVSCGYIGTVLADLAALGYVGRWGVLGAADAGAPHKRDRLWIVAHAEGQSSDVRSNYAECRVGAWALSESRNRSWETHVAHAKGRKDRRLQQPRLAPDAAASGSHVADANRFGSSGPWWSFDPSGPASEGNRKEHRAFDGSRWGVESPVGRVAHGVANRVDRLKAIGNGQVPAVVRLAWEALA